MQRVVCAWVVLASAAGAAIVAASGGCAGDDASTAADASLDVVVLPGPVDATGNVDGGDGATASTLVRVAHLAPDVGPLDVCWRTAPSEAFTGPLLVPPPIEAGAALDAATYLDASDAAAPVAPQALVYPSVSGYLELPSGSVEIAMVSAWDRSCASPRARLRVTFDPGERATLALVGVPGADAGSDRELGLVPLVDDATTDPARARVRLVHAALGSTKLAGALDAGAGAGVGPLAAAAVVGAAEVPLAARVDPRHAASPSTAPPVVDALGYHLEAPFGAAALLLTPRDPDAGSVGPWTSGVASLGAAAGSLHTGFVVVDADRGLAVLWCDDLAPAASCALVR